jgi:hypothetical protein
MLPRLDAVRYETPLREGGSLPAIVEASDGRRYVMKFSGAGQGPRALIAEILGAGLARAAGLPVPDLALLDLAEGFGRTEPDPEIQDLLRKSTGVNVGLRYLPGSIGYDPYAMPGIEPARASAIVWVDAYLMNPDRTLRNPNLLLWNEEIYLIDHGASLYFHHSWRGWRDKIASPFAGVRDHVLLPFATALEEADASLPDRLLASVDDVVSQVPDEWLGNVPDLGGGAEHRAAYVEFLRERLSAPRDFAAAARRAHVEASSA